MSFEKVSQGIAILLGVGTILSLILAPLTIISYSNTIKAPFLLPVIFSTVSFQMIPFFIALIIIIILLPFFLGIYATYIVGKTKKDGSKLYLETAGIALLISLPLTFVYIIQYEFFARRFESLDLFILLLLLPPIIAVLTSIIWRSNLEKKELSGENQSCSSGRSPIDKKFYPLILAIVVLTASQYFFSKGYFRWMGYGDYVVKISNLKDNLKTPTTNAIKGYILFDSGKEMYVRLDSSCSDKNQKSGWVIRVTDKFGVAAFSHCCQKDSGSIVRIPYKDIIDFEPDH